MSGDEFNYGGDDNDYIPYILSPRRHVRLTFAKLSWVIDDVNHQFNADCRSGSSNCMGLAHELKASGRWLFAGTDALPMKHLMAADFRSPVPLVKLTTRPVWVPSRAAYVDFERLNFEYFDVKKWDPQANQSLGGTNCSMLIDSYINTVEDNNYYLERPLQAMYTSATYYLFQNAAVTKINDTTLLKNASVLAKGRAEDSLFNLKLDGDVQLREITMQIPLNAAIPT